MAYKERLTPTQIMGRDIQSTRGWGVYELGEDIGGCGTHQYILYRGHTHNRVPGHRL